MKHALELKKQIVEKDEDRKQHKKVVEIENQKFQETCQGKKALL